jgi:hypothetical protein
VQLTLVAQCLTELNVYGDEQAERPRNVDAQWLDFFLFSIQNMDFAVTPEFSPPF